MNLIQHPNYITFQNWVTIKQYTDLSKGVKNFRKEDADLLCVFYDEHHNFMDWLKIREVENREPSYVLLPKFFWETHKEDIPEEFIPDLNMSERIKILEKYKKKHKDILVSDKPPVFQCELVPRAEQVPLLDGLIDIFKKEGRVRGVVSAAPGFGKTASSIKTLHNLNARGVIVVPNEVLSDQWQEAIMQFTDLKKEDIAIIEGSDSIKIQQEIHGKNIAIVKIQSLYSQLKRISIDELSNLYDEFDVVIYDECHTSGAAEGYAKTSSIFKTHNIIGMSATPYRVGINDYLLKVSIGETIYKSEHKNLIPDIEIYRLGIEFSPKEIQKLASVRGDFIMFSSFFNMFLATKQKYFDYLADWVNYNNSLGHNIVVLFATNKMVKRLKETVEERHPHLKSEKLLSLTGTTKKDSQDLVKIERQKMMLEYKKFKEEQDLLVKQKNLKRKEAQENIKRYRADLDEKVSFMKENALDLYKQKIKDANIIISNFNLLSAGFDKSELSNIIYGSPRIGKVAVIQSLGRITRIHDGKLKPLAQFFFPDVYLTYQKSAPIILINNIRIEYDTANIQKIGF